MRADGTDVGASRCERRVRMRNAECGVRSAEGAEGQHALHGRLRAGGGSWKLGVGSWELEGVDRARPARERDGLAPVVP